MARCHEMKQGGENVLVVGGGVIGLCCAYFLSKRGHQVTVIDRDPGRNDSCSGQNAGMVVPSHFTPLAAPGVVSQGLKWMFNRRSPFFLRPRFDVELMRWCCQFLRHSNRQHVENSQTLLRDLSLESRALFTQLADELNFNLVERGLLMLCHSEAGFEEEREVAEAANRLGIQAEVCDPKRLREIDSGTEMAAIGGVWFPQDAHLNPQQFLDVLRRAIEHNGGVFQDGEVAGFKRENQTVTQAILADGECVEVGNVVLAGGSWTPELAASLHLRLPMQAGKGYSFTLPKPNQSPHLCSLLKEGRVAVTPMDDVLRVAGTMEICGNDLSVDQVRAEGIVSSFCRFFPKFSADDFSGLEIWSGLRPCSPDGLPYIGRLPGAENGFVATGHSMLGLSLGPVTGRLMADLLEDSTCDDRLRPGRFDSNHLNRASRRK